MSDTKVPKNLTTKVIERFMSASELEQFFVAYRKSKRTPGGSAGGRQNSLSQPVNDDQKELLKAYLFDTDTPVSTMEQQNGMKKNTLPGKVKVYAIRYLHQHPELLK